MLRLNLAPEPRNVGQGWYDYFSVEADEQQVVIDNGLPYDEQQRVVMDLKQARELRDLLNLMNL